MNVTEILLLLPPVENLAIVYGSGLLNRLMINQNIIFNLHEGKYKADRCNIFNSLKLVITSLYDENPKKYEILKAGTNIFQHIRLFLTF